MVYIRSKNVKGIDYAYLVKSEWQGSKKAPRQATIKYLGKASRVEIDDIPEAYRNDPKVVAFLSEHNPTDIRKRAAMIESSRNQLYDQLTSGDVDAAIQLYKNSRELLSLEDFYDKVLRTAMYDVGYKWESGIIDIATEHVASNAARSLVSSIIEITQSGQTRRCILLCCPEGELHYLSTLVLESVLRSKGYGVINAAPSLPADSLLHYIDENKLDLLMVSVTMPESIPSARRLVNTILEKFGKQIPVIVGGSAFVKSTDDFPDATLISPRSSSLREILRIVKSSIRPSVRRQS